MGGLGVTWAPAVASPHLHIFLTETSGRENGWGGLEEEQSPVYHVIIVTSLGTTCRILNVSKLLLTSFMFYDMNQN